MPKTVAYIRASTDKQDVDNQKLQVLEFAQNKNIRVHEFIQLTVSSTKSEKERRIEQLLEILKPNDVLIITELSRLGRSTTGVILLVNELLKRDIQLIVLKQGLNLVKHDMNSKIIVTLFSLFAELERDMISQRTRDALATKRSQGIKLGKPKGTIQKSKFDAHKEKIIELLLMGLSVRKIAKFLGYTNNIGLNTYIRKHNLKP